MSMNLSARHQPPRSDRSMRYSNSNIGTGVISDSIGGLDFSPFRVDSRTQAFESLGAVYHNVKNPPTDGIKEQTSSTSNMILISGVSGTGKSTLVEQFITEVNIKSNLGKDTKPYFLMGKYNEKSGSDPYSAIITAFSDFARDLMPYNSNERVSEETEKEVNRLRRQVKGKLGSDAQQLVKVIPDLNQLLGHVGLSSHNEEDSKPSANAWNRLKYVFQAFVSAISTKERPLILFLDDLQWIDDASLKLIYSLMVDSDLQHFMFIGAYRSDEVNSGDALWNTLERVQMVQEFETIELTNLSKSELEDFVAHMLCLEKQRKVTKDKHDQRGGVIDELADILHKKTDGNLFFASQTIKELEEKEVLTFSLVTSVWDLNWTTVDKSGYLTDDVMAMVAGKISHSSPLLQQILKTMAFTKSPTDISRIGELLDGNGVQVSLVDLVEELELGASQGLLSHKIGSPDYNFAHDKIQEAAYSLVSEGQDRRDYRSSVGMKLLKMYNGAKKSNREDWMLFVATDHLNAASESKSEFLFKLNIKAGAKAASVAAYETSSKFLRLALDYISDQTRPWKSKYDLSLRTHQQLAEVLLCQGEYEHGKAVAQTLFYNAKTIDDKLPTLIELSVALGKEHKQKESMKLSIKTLRKLKEYPKGKAGAVTGIMADLLEVKRFFKRNTDEDVLKLPLMKNERKRNVMRLLKSAMYQAQYSGDKLTSLSVILKMLRFTFKSGLCAESVVAIVMYSVIVDRLNDIEGRKRLMTLSAKVIEKTKADDEESTVHFVQAFYYDGWNDSLDHILSTMQRGASTGMQYGRFENAFMCTSAATAHKFNAGFPLPAILLEYESLFRKMSLYSVNVLDALILEIYNSCRVLAGAEELDFAKLSDFESTPYDPSQYLVRKTRYLSCMRLGMFFGNLEFCEKILAAHRQLPDHDRSFQMASQHHFFASLCYSSFYLKTKKKSYLRGAKRAYKALTALATPRGSNCQRRCKLMKAHMDASQGGRTTSHVKQLYDDVIAEASTSGHKNDAGLVAQLAADYFLQNGGHDDNQDKRETLLSRTYLEKARELYQMWGANALVEHVEDQIQSLQHVSISSKGTSNPPSSSADTQHEQL